MVLMSNHKHFMVFGSILLASIMLISMLYVAAPVSNQRNSNVIAYNEVGSSIRDNITFTGNVAKDFSGHLIYHNTVTSLWGEKKRLYQWQRNSVKKVLD